MQETTAKYYKHMGCTPTARNMLDSLSLDFARETCKQAFDEFADKELQLSFVTSAIDRDASKNWSSIAVYETSETHVFLILLHTKKAQRGQGACRDLVKEVQSQNSKKKLVLETRKYSEEHAIFEMMGFCSVSAEEFKGATTTIRLDSKDSPVILEYNLKDMKAPPEIAHTRSILKQLKDSGHCISVHVQASKAMLEEGAEQQKDAFHKMQKRLPNLIDFGSSWFFRVAGKEYCDWLFFQLKKIHMELWKNKSSTKDLGKRMRSKWLIPEAGYDVQRFKPGRLDKREQLQYIDLMLLNEISNVSGLCFMPVSMNGDGELVQVKPPGVKEVSNVHILLSGLTDRPKFLLTPNIDWVLPLLPSSGASAAKKHDSIRELVKWLAPQPSAGQATSNPDTMAATCRPKATRIALSIPSTQAPPMSACSKKSREDGLVVFSGGKICPSLLAIGSGIALTTNGKVCHTPMPSINRGLSSDRFQVVMPRIEEGYKSDEQGEGMKEQFSLFPYNWSSASALSGSSWELQDPANAEIGSLAGNLIATPLDAKSIQRLMKAFSLTTPNKAVTEKDPSKEAGSTNNSHLLQEPEGRLELLSLSLLAIQAEFQMFQTEESFQKLLVHLLLVWQKEQEQERRKLPKLVDICCFTSTAGSVLLIKMLWVTLGFPVLAPVEGLARLYCANDLLLKHNKGFLPPGLAHAGPNVDFVGVSHKLIVEDEEDGLVAFEGATSFVVSGYAIKCQDRMSGITRIGLGDIMQHCCLAIKLDSKIVIQQGWTSSMKIQAEKLARQLEGMMAKSKGGFVEYHFSGGTSPKTDWQGKLKQLKPSSTLKGRLPVTVLVFRFMLAPLHLQLDSKKVVCKTPFESILQFILSNGKHNPDRIWWIPDANNHNNGRHGSLSWLVQFDEIIVQTLVDLMARAFTYHYLNDEGVTQAQKKKRLVFQNLLKVWLHSYLLELVGWGGMHIAMPKKLHQDFSALQFLFHPVLIQENNPNLFSLASKLQQCQQKSFVCNLYGVVTYVLLYIESMNDMSFVQGLEAGVAENTGNQDWDALIQKACPLFQGQTESEKDKKWSMFELTKWLLSDSGNVLGAARNVEDALSRQQGDIRVRLENFVVEGTLETDNKDLFLEILVRLTKKKKYCKFKADVKYILSQEEDSLYPTVWDPDGKEIEFFFLQKLSHNWMFLGNVPKQILEPIVKHCKSKRYEEAFDKMRVMKICHLGPVGTRLGVKKQDCNGKVFMSHDGSYDRDNGCEMKLCQQVVDGLHNIEDGGVEYIQGLEVQSFGTVGHVDGHLPSKNDTHSTPNWSTSKEEGEEDSQGLLCVMPLGEAGCTFHLHMQERETEELEVTVVYIPYGFMLVFDDKEYRGGHYAPSSTNKTFICRVGTNSSNSNGREDCFALMYTPGEPHKFPVSAKELNSEIQKMQEKYELQKEDENVKEVHELVGKDDEPRTLLTRFGKSVACFEAYACPFIPLDIMANAIRYLRSEEFSTQFDEGMSQTESKDWNTCTPIAGLVKGHFYEFGGNLYSEDQVGGTTPEVEPIVDHVKSQLSLLTNLDLKWWSCMVIGTVQPSHQVYHVDYPPIFHQRDREKKAFLCFIPLVQTGYTIRLAQLSSQACQKVRSAVKPQTDLVFFSEDEKPVLDAHVYVHVPFGAALILDVREFHGGHYINENDLCLLCVLSTFPWDLDSKEHTFTFLRTFLPYPKTKAKDVHGHDDLLSDAMKTGGRKDYLKEFKQIMEAPSIRWDCDCESPDVKLVVVTKGRSPNRSYHVVASPMTAIVSIGALSTSHQVTATNVFQAQHIAVGKEVSGYYTEVTTKATNNSESHLSSILIQDPRSTSAEIARAPPMNFNDAVSFIIERGEKVSTTQEDASFAKWSFHLNWNETPQPCHLEWLRWPAKYLWEVATTNRNATMHISKEEIGFTACRVDLYEIKDEVTQDFPELGAALGPDTVTGTMIFMLSNGPPSGTEKCDQPAAKRQKTLKFPSYYLVITFHKEDLCGSLLKDLKDSLLKGLDKADREEVQRIIGKVSTNLDPVARIGAHHVSIKGFKTLKTRTWVNEEVITCYATLLLQQNTKENGAFHIYIPSFYKLLKNGKGYQDVKILANKDVPHEDIFRLQKILVPINFVENHWLCAVIYIQRKEIQVYDSWRDDGSHLDRERQVMNDLLKFLEDYHSSKNSKKDLDEPAFDRGGWSLVDTKPTPPQLENRDDCGVFTCLFLEFLSLGITEIPPLTPVDINICRQKIGLALMRGAPILPSFRNQKPIPGPSVVFLKSGLSQQLHKQFAHLLSDEDKFETGSTFGEHGVSKMPPTCHSDAKFYVGDKLKSGTKVRLLDDGSSYGTLGKNVHKLEDETFKQLFKLFSLHGYEFDMMTIRRSQKLNVISGFKPHKDKTYFEKGVAFVSLGVPFWTVIATSEKDPNDYTNAFKDWVGSVDEDEQKVLNDFMKQFSSECCSIYHCTATTVLAFKARALTHGTIIPASHHDRYVCILNELLAVK